MKFRLFSFFLITLAVIACQNTATEPEPAVQYPILTGTWKITSANDASWIGAPNKAKVPSIQADSTTRDTTVYLTRPEGQSLRMDRYRRGSNNGQAVYGTMMRFVDSTIVEPDSIYYEAIDEYVDPSYIITWGYFVDFPEHSYLADYWEPKEKIDLTDDGFKASWPIQYPCSSGPQAGENAIVKVRLIMLLRGTVATRGEAHIQTFRHYIIDIDGMSEVVRHFHCDN